MITHYYISLAIIILIYVAIVVTCYLDMWAGIRKAKIRGEVISSKKMDKTSAKICKYYVRTAAAFIPDIIVLLITYLCHEAKKFEIPEIPIFTIITGLSCIATEVFSIWEPANNKEKMEQQKQSEIIKKILENEIIKRKL